MQAVVKSDEQKKQEQERAEAETKEMADESDEELDSDVSPPFGCLCMSINLADVAQECADRSRGA